MSFGNLVTGKKFAWTHIKINCSRHDIVYCYPIWSKIMFEELLETDGQKSHLSCSKIMTYTDTNSDTLICSIWPAVWESGPFAICEQGRPRSNWACTVWSGPLFVKKLYNIQWFCIAEEKGMVSLSACAGCFDPLLFANNIRDVFLCWAK